ncbi:hypothetical protein FGB62_110g13 [Gracilaria domingensis]|nr:hypothetical protein FGB62_110g13 [Gracilaria domingensis]
MRKELAFYFSPVPSGADLIAADRRLPSLTCAAVRHGSDCSQVTVCESDRDVSLHGIRTGAPVCRPALELPVRKQSSRAARNDQYSKASDANAGPRGGGHVDLHHHRGVQLVLQRPDYNRSLGHEELHVSGSGRETR